MSAAPDVLVDASPAGLTQSLGLAVRVVRVRYELEQTSGPALFPLVEAAIA